MADTRRRPSPRAELWEWQLLGTCRDRNQSDGPPVRCSPEPAGPVSLKRPTG